MPYNNRPQEPINQRHNHPLPVHKLSSKKAVNQPRVYNVKPIHFRELVQRLTGTSQTQPPSTQLFKSSAPPPIQLRENHNVRPPPPPAAAAAMNDPSSQDLMADIYQKKIKVGSAYSNGFMVGDSMELSLSPTSSSWFSFPLLSPGPSSNFGP